MDMKDVRNDVIVIGAGYAGLLAANRLARSHRVTVLNDRPCFVERVRLHQVVAGTDRGVTRPLATMLDRRCRLVVDEVTGLGDGVVSTASGDRLEAGHIVLAAGSGDRGGVGSWEGALELRDRVAALDPGALVRVSGAGLTGIETAAEVAAARPDLSVLLVDPKGLAPFTSQRHRTRIASSLARLGVDFSDRLEPMTTADLEVDCTGFGVPSLARRCGLPVDQDGLLLVDPDLSVPGRPGLWGAGDCVRVAQAPHLRMACATAMPMGAHVAAQIAAVDAGDRPEPFDLGYLGHCVSLGRRDGILIHVTRSDRPRLRALHGRPAAVVKEAVCRYASGVARWPRFYSWPGSGRSGADRAGSV